MKAGRASIGIFQKTCIKNLRGGQGGPIKKTRLLHIGNVEKPHHPQLSTQRACEGQRLQIYEKRQ